MNLKTHKALTWFGWIVFAIAMIATFSISHHNMASSWEVVTETTAKPPHDWIPWQSKTTLAEYTQFLNWFVTGLITGFLGWLVASVLTRPLKEAVLVTLGTIIVGLVFGAVAWSVAGNMSLLVFGIVFGLSQYTKYVWAEKWSDVV